jgi:fructose-bisphosphate aldolase class II
MLIGMIRAAAKIYPKAKFAVHLDHGVESHVFDAINSESYDSVMIDASHDDFNQNVKRTQAVVEKAKAKQIFVEAELGVLSGVEDDISVDEKMAKYTHPDEALQFVNETQCNSLAVAVGTSHGAYKFSGGQGIQFDILKKIQEKLPYYPIVLHGGSAVNKEEIVKINKNGGKLLEGAAGVDPKEIVKAIKYGVCKINIATDLRLIWTRVHREFFNETPDLFDPIIPGKLYMDAYEQFMLEKFDLLGATGKSNQFI